MEGVKLGFTEDALKSIAEKAIKRKTGARGLRSIMEGILLDTMFELPSLNGVTEMRDQQGGRREPGGRRSRSTPTARATRRPEPAVASPWRRAVRRRA